MLWNPGQIRSGGLHRSGMWWRAHAVCDSSRRMPQTTRDAHLGFIGLGRRGDVDGPAPLGWLVAGQPDGCGCSPVLHEAVGHHAPAVQDQDQALHHLDCKGLQLLWLALHRELACRGGHLTGQHTACFAAAQVGTSDGSKRCTAEAAAEPQGKAQHAALWHPHHSTPSQPGPAQQRPALRSTGAWTPSHGAGQTLALTARVMLPTPRMPTLPQSAE